MPALIFYQILPINYRRKWEFVGHLGEASFWLHTGQAEGRRRYFLIIARTIKMHSGNICRKGTFSIKFLDFLYIKENDQQRTALSIFRKRNVYLLISIYKPAWQKKSWIFKQNRLIFPGTIDLATNEVILTASYS